jgi:hypothetical protein
VAGDAWVDVVIVVAVRGRRANIEQDSAKRELLGAVSVGKESVVTNAMEATRRYVEEEASYEFGDLDSHDFVVANAVFPIVPPAEADVGLVEIEQATVGDRDAMGVTREIGQDLLRTREGFFRIDDPFGFAKGSESGCKRLRVVEADKIGEELQFTSFECCSQTLEKQLPEHAREHANGKKESRPASDPTLAVWRDATAWYDAMGVRMVAPTPTIP